MVIRIETQSRKKAKLTPYMDVMDFQFLLLSGLVIPMSLWLVLGIPWQISAALPVGYLWWMLKFKVGKPSGYWIHWLNRKLRGKHWSAYSQNPIHPEFLKLRGVR